MRLIPRAALGSASAWTGWKDSFLARVSALILAVMLVFALSGSQSVLADSESESDMSSEEIYGSSDPSSEEASGSAVGDPVPIENLYVERWSPADAPGKSSWGTCIASRVKTGVGEKFVYMFNSKEDQTNSGAGALKSTSG